MDLPFSNAWTITLSLEDELRSFSTYFACLHLARFVLNLLRSGHRTHSDKGLYVLRLVCLVRLA